MTLQITIDQSGKPAGTAGQAREDLDLGTAVDLVVTGGVSVTEYQWSLLYAPPNEAMTVKSSAAFTAATAATTQLTPIDNRGTYFVQCAVNQGYGLGARAEDIVRITFYAGTALSSDPALLPRRRLAFLETTEHNVPDALDAGGNVDGWAREQERWFRVIENTGAPTARINMIYVAKHGNDSNSGLHPDAAKLTVGAALTVAGALTLSDTVRAIVNVIDSGTYNEQVVVPEWCFLNAPSAMFTGVSAGTPQVIVQTDSGSDTVSGGARVHCFAPLTNQICVSVDNGGAGAVHIGALYASVSGAVGVYTDDSQAIVSLDHGLFGGNGACFRAEGTGNITFSARQMDLVGATAVGVHVNNASALVRGHADRINSQHATSNAIVVTAGEANITGGHIGGAGYVYAVSGTLRLTAAKLSGSRTATGTVYVTVAGALHISQSNEVHQLTQKVIPAVDDVLLVEDSAASWIKKRVRIGDLSSAPPSAILEIPDLVLLVDSDHTAGEQAGIEGDISVGAPNWTASNATATGSGPWTLAAVATGDSYVEGASGTRINVSTNGTCLIEVWAESNTADFLLVRLGTGKTVWYDLGTGNLGTSAGVLDAGIENTPSVGTYVYRCWLLIDEGDITSFRLYVCDADAATGSAASSSIDVHRVRYTQMRALNARNIVPAGAVTSLGNATAAQQPLFYDPVTYEWGRAAGMLFWGGSAYHALISGTGMQDFVGPPPFAIYAVVTPRTATGGTRHTIFSAVEASNKHIRLALEDATVVFAIQTDAGGSEVYLAATAPSVDAMGFIAAYFNGFELELRMGSGGVTYNIAWEYQDGVLEPNALYLGGEPGTYVTPNEAEATIWDVAVIAGRAITFGDATDTLIRTHYGNKHGIAT